MDVRGRVASLPALGGAVGALAIELLYVNLIIQQGAVMPGYRVPLIVISPYAKKHYVNHNVADYTAILKLIEKRFNLPSLTKRDAAAIVAHRNITICNRYLHTLAMAHGVLIYTVIYHFLHQYVDTIVHTAAIAQLAYVHARAQPYMFPPVEGLDTILCILIL